MASRGWKEAAIAVLFVTLNALVVVYGVGMDSEVFSWKAFAQTYVPPGSDPGDVTGNDPSGCFYNPDNGQIIPGASIGATGATVLDDGSATGCFEVVLGPGSMMAQTSGGPMTQVTLSVLTLPLGCSIDPCFTQIPTNVPGSVVLQPGNLPDAGNPGFLTSPGCTPFFNPMIFEETGTGSGVIGNNVPLECATVPAQAPVLSTVGWVALGLLLFGLGWWGLRQRDDETA